MNDLKFPLRQLLKNPGFTAVAVLTHEILDFRFAICDLAAGRRNPASRHDGGQFAGLPSQRLNYIPARQTGVGNRQLASPIANRKSEIANR